MVRQAAELFLGAAQRDIDRRDVLERLLVFRVAVVRECMVDVERQSALAIRDRAKNRLGFAQLIVGQACQRRTQSGRSLNDFDFLRSFLGRGFLPAREILPNADAMQPAGDAP